MMIDVTVLMVVRNCEDYVSEAIESVLKQNFQNFELLIVDDGSTDKTGDIILQYDDSRIQRYFRPHDYIGNLNFGLSMARGKYIARLDGDDLMHTSRLKIQVKRMERDHLIDVCGTWCIFFESSKAFCPKHSHAGYRMIEDPVKHFFNTNFIVHSSVLIKREFLEKEQIKYSKEYPMAEDYAMWFDIAQAKGNFYVEPQELTFIRTHSEQVSTLNSIQMQKSSWRLKYDNLLLFLHKNMMYDELEITSTLSNYKNKNPDALPL